MRRVSLTIRKSLSLLQLRYHHYTCFNGSFPGEPTLSGSHVVFFPHLFR